MEKYFEALEFEELSMKQLQDLQTSGIHLYSKEIISWKVPGGKANSIETNVCCNMNDLYVDELVKLLDLGILTIKKDYRE